MVVDLVRDRVAQVGGDKPLFGIVRVDPMSEIVANKLCTILGRSEIRDLVDLCALEAAGCRLDVGLGGAALKDGGVTPAQLAWVLSQIEIPPTASVPGRASADELRQYQAGLIDRLAKMSWPA